MVSLTIGLMSPLLVRQQGCAAGGDSESILDQADWLGPRDIDGKFTDACVRLVPWAKGKV